MKQRIITAAIAIAVFLPLAIWGGLPFTLLVYAMASIGLHELFKMRKQPFFTFPGILSLVLLWILLLPEDVFAAYNFTGFGKAELGVMGVLLFLVYTVAVKNSFTFDDAGFFMMAILYVGIGFHFMIATREAGIVYLFFALFIVWVTDSGAYFIGRAAGKRKLWPEISPNKTIEGSLGGIIAAVVVALIFFFFTGIDIPLGKLLVITVILSAFGQVGDLAESALKRHYDVKDSGKLMPGHGGILDRCDSWLFVLPLFYLLAAL